MAEQYQYYLTTTDNPFDPCEQFDAWLNYDKLMGYDTLELLAREARTSDDELSDAENEREIDEAITRIIVRDPLNIYIRVRKQVPMQTQVDSEA